MGTSDRFVLRYDVKLPKDMSLLVDLLLLSSVVLSVVHSPDSILG